MSDLLPSQEPAPVNAMVAAVVTASRVLVAISARSLAAVEEPLTVPQFRMLVVLDTSGGASLTRLAEQLAVNPSTAMRMVDRLSTAGMVERTPDPEDRRVVRLVATEAGRRVVHAVTERRRAEIAEIVAAMPHEDRGAMVQALQAFADAAGEPQVDPTAYAGLLLPGWT